MLPSYGLGVSSAPVIFQTLVGVHAAHACSRMHWQLRAHDKLQALAAAPLLRLMDAAYTRPVHLPTWQGSSKWSHAYTIAPNNGCAEEEEDVLCLQWLSPQKEKRRRRGRCALSTVTISTKRETQKKRKMCFVYSDYLHKKRNAEEEEDVLCLLWGLLFQIFAFLIHFMCVFVCIILICALKSWIFYSRHLLQVPICSWIRTVGVWGSQTSQHLWTCQVTVPTLEQWSFHCQLILFLLKYVCVRVCVCVCVCVRACTLMYTCAHRHVGICVYIGMGVRLLTIFLCILINIVCFKSAVSILSMKYMHLGLIWRGHSKTPLLLLYIIIIIKFTKHILTSMLCCFDNSFVLGFCS